MADEDKPERELRQQEETAATSAPLKWTSARSEHTDEVIGGIGARKRALA